MQRPGSELMLGMEWNDSIPSAMSVRIQNFFQTKKDVCYDTVIKRDELLI